MAPLSRELPETQKSSLMPLFPLSSKPKTITNFLQVLSSISMYKLLISSYFHPHCHLHQTPSCYYLSFGPLVGLPSRLPVPSLGPPILHPEQVESCQSPAEDSLCTWDSFQRFLLVSSRAPLPLTAVIPICFLNLPHALPVQAVLNWVSLISFPREPKSLLTFLLFFYGTENLQFPIYLFGYSFNFCKLCDGHLFCVFHVEDA